jgi:glycosyl transferase family 87/dolichyl-phosphate-mannose-protein mannosyltransferase
MRPLGEACLRLARRAVAVAETRRGVGVVFLAALAVWWLQALVIPLGPGRDFGTYLGSYAQLFHSDPIDLGYVLGRTPLAPLFMGALLDFVGGALAEPAVSLLYAASIVAWFLAARTFGGKAALLTAVVLVAYPGYGILFHELSSDTVFAAAFAGWALLFVRVIRAPSPARFALVGAGVGVLALIRPANQTLLVLALLPLMLRTPWRARIVSSAAFLLPAVVLLAGWAVHNGLRYDTYTVARGGNATVPFYRTFVTDKIVRPSNGPASRELAREVEHRLLPEEPYRSYGITIDDFFGQASSRMQEDLLALSDRVKGWDSDHRWLRDVGVEAVGAHPATYARGVVGSISGMLKDGLYRSLPASGDGRSTPGGVQETVVVNGQTLPKPSEDQPIPAAHEGGVATPDGSIYTVWTSPTEHHLVFVHPGDAKRYRALHSRMDELAANLPDREGSASLARRLNQASRWFPPPGLWLLLGLAALLVRRPRGALGLSVPAAAGLLVIVLSALGLPAEPHYAVPVAPAFVLLAAGGLFARRREPISAAETEGSSFAARLASWRARPWVPDARSYLGIAVGLAAAAWATWIYFDKVDGSFAAGQAPHDLGVFLRAAGKVLDGASPYAFRGDETYAYPPLLAFLAAPFHPLSAGAATLAWTLLSLAAIAAALWLLGVRDWRCYALAAVFPFTRSAVGLGTVGPLLLLLVSAAWRWREQVIHAGAAAGAAFALKLFLWPLVAWLALTRRIGAAAAGVGFAVALALIPWAVIGFAGIGDYPDVLRRLADDEATSSYSVIALAVRAHLPETAGVILSLLAAAALLAAARWTVRDESRTEHDRDVAVLTLALAAALAASPIVWVHYFLLLLVPLALTRPRLSALWFLPFAYYPLGETAWPAGDARKLGLALVTTTLLFVAVLYRRGDPRRIASRTPQWLGPFWVGRTRVRESAGAAGRRPPA